MQRNISQQRATITSSTEKSDENTNWSQLKDNKNDSFFTEKKINESSFLASLQTSTSTNLNEPITTSLNSNLNKFSNDMTNFVKMCKQKFDNSELPADFDRGMVKQQHDYLMNNIDKYFPNIPASLKFILPAAFEDGDCGRSLSEKPDWLDMDKFRRGQAFVQRYFVEICFTQLMSLIGLLTFPEALKVEMLNQKSNSPYRAFKRFLSLTLRLNHWYQDDPWNEGTQTHCHLQIVRKLHLRMRRRVCSYSDKQIDAMSQLPNAYCPMLKAITEDFTDSCPMRSDLQCPFTMTRLKSLNQGEMSYTQFGFMGLMVLYPEKFGVHRVSDADLDAFCYVWRVFGYLLGIEDRYNFCRGSLQDVRRRCVDFIEYWMKPNMRTVTPEWEHLSICIYEGASYYLPVTSYKVYLLYFCDILNLKMPRLRKSLNLLENVTYVIYKFVLNYLTMLPFFNVAINMLVRMYLKLAEDFTPEKHAELKKKSRETPGFEKLPD